MTTTWHGRKAALVVVLAALTGLLGYWAGGVHDSNKATSFSDQFGRSCTQVSTGLDCDYKPLFAGSA